MVVARIYGGLGNQMSQYAAGLGLAERLSTRLVLDTRWFDNPLVHRRYELDAFGIDAPLRLRHRLRFKLRRAPVFKKEGYVYQEAFEHLRGDVILDGTWNDPAYFAHCEARVRAAFRCHRPLSAEQQALRQEIQAAEAVAVHVRRGDYTKPKYAKRYGLLPLSYYDAGMAYLVERVPEPTFFVFSDDIAWCKDAFAGRPNVRFSEHGDPSAAYSDLCLMAACKHAIVANSTLSWWGAWLIEHRANIVVAPETWVLDPVYEGHNSALPDWVLLPSVDGEHLGEQRAPVVDE